MQETSDVEGNNLKERPEVPASWLTAVSGPEGKRKSVIFYYADLSPLYTDGEKMLKKIADVLKTFEENRGSVTVLWHQDPNLKRFLSVQKPGLWGRYEQLMQAFSDAGYGILDDTAAEDADYFEQIRTAYPGPGPTPAERRAIDFSDAFYGDGGFLSNCFRNEGKPVMIQNPDILCGLQETV